MRWDRHTLMAFSGIAALVIGGVLLLEDAGAAFVQVIAMVAGIAAMARANHERLKQRMDALETRPGAGGVARRDQPRRLNTGSMQPTPHYAIR
jgi:hypothetical protein